MIDILVMAFNAQATSLDGIYRDIIRSNNSGYLPLFVKNRHQPDVLLSDEELKKVIPATNNLKTIDPNKRLKLSSDFAEIDALDKARHYQWLKIDPKAFVSQSAVIGVFGEGFDDIKVGINTKKKKEE